MNDLNENPNISDAKEFLRDYVESNQDLIDPWLSGLSREDLGAELILLCLESRKIGVSYDLTGIAQGYCVELIEHNF